MADGAAAAAAAGPAIELLDFCGRLPKLELHAHLNGCVRPATIRELAQQAHGLRGVPDAELQRLTSTGHRSLADCFVLFSAVHELTTTHAAVQRITQEVVADFAADGVIYLELRTTPKDRPEHGITKRSYMAAVLEGLAACRRQAQQQAKQQAQQRGQQEAPRCSQTGDSNSSSSSSGVIDCGGIDVALLLSIDRRNDTAAALDTVELAIELMPAGVVGVDLSGDPSIGSWDSWLPALQRARSAGLKVTLHAAEVPAPAETHAMLDFGPERLCHMVCTDEALEARLAEARIPVELCLTSNLKTGSTGDAAAHHFGALHARGHPVALCTDDSGIFGTTLSREFALAADAFGLSRRQLAQLAAGAVEHCFCGEAAKRRLRARLEAFAAAEGLQQL